jgi:adenine/guanine phosphoribosyltransferase-like PRPP-binding protein
MAHTPNYCHVGYLRELLPTDRLRATVDEVAAVLQQYDFDAIAFRGMSGALLAPPLALKLDKSLLMVRKEDVNSHSGYPVEGDLAAMRYVIVDDVVDSGLTLKKIVQRVAKFAPQAECIGYLCVNFNRAQLETTVRIRGVSTTMQELRELE